MDAVTALAPQGGLIAATCTALGLSRASLHRREAARKQPRAIARARPKPPRALSDAEQQHILEMLRGPRFVDLAPAEIYACLLDEGAYLCSIRTMYRVLAKHGEVRERRRAIAPSRLSKARASGDRTQSGLVLGHHKTDGTGQMDLLLSLCDPGYFQP